MSKRSAIIVSGFFNPLRKKHIEYFHNVKSKADRLLVIIKNNTQCQLKGFKKFQTEKERLYILENIGIVDEAYIALDKDLSVSASLSKIHKLYADHYDLIFVNAEEKTPPTITENRICERLGITLIEEHRQQNKVQVFTT